jgi:hypothetical protein
MENQALETVLRHHRKFATRLVLDPFGGGLRKRKGGRILPASQKLPAYTSSNKAIARYLLKTIYKTQDLRIIPKTKIN